MIKVGRTTKAQQVAIHWPTIFVELRNGSNELDSS